MTDVIRRTVVRGPARVLINEITASRPQSVEDILDPKTFEAVNNWRDIGPTRIGILEVDDTVMCVFAETTTEKIAEIVALLGGPFQLAAVWNTAEEADENMHLAFRHYPSVQIGTFDGDDGSDGAARTTVFVRFP